MYEYDEYNPKKKDEYEETEQESIANSADGMEGESHVDGESIEMEAETGVMQPQAKGCWQPSESKKRGTA